jgi:hypothetical protein
MHLQLNSLEAQNSEYKKAIPGIEERPKAVGVAINALQNDQN